MQHYVNSEANVNSNLIIGFKLAIKSSLFRGLFFHLQLIKCNGYDGVFIGKSSENWHLEFTKTKEVISFDFKEDDILVFYPASKTEFDLLVHKLQSHEIEFIKAKNPYWNENGKMILDPDGYRILISDLKIRA